MLVEDIDGNNIRGIDFGIVERGDITDPFPIVIFNNTTENKFGVQISAGYSAIGHTGLEMDTINSTFISLDGVDAFLEQTINLLPGEKKIIYLHFQPTSNALPSYYQWSLIIQET